jgi:NAD(P)H-dependent FMN reductase
MKLLALAASHREPSLNKDLLARAISLAEASHATVTTLDYAVLECAFYHGEHVALPEGAAKFADALLAHDGILIATPEYNWSIPGGLKNLIDWMSVDDRAPLAGKTALLMCASPSPRGGVSGLQHLRVPLEVLGTWVYPQMIGIGHYDAAAPMSAKNQKHLADCVSDFVRATEALSYAR